MKIGMTMMSRGSGARPDGVNAIARHAEACDFDILAVNDHVVVPADIGSRYPYSEGGDWAGAKAGECLDILVMLGYLAAATEKIELLSSVLVVPHRPAVVTAKMLSSIDLLSGGRLSVGCGAGWMAEEFAAIGAPPFPLRGKVTNEYIEVFRQCWREDRPAYDGDHATFSDILFEPKAAQAGGPPIWIGGESPPAIRRAARLGDAWYPASINPRFPMDTPERLKAGIDKLRREAETAGRDPNEIAVNYFSIAPADGPADAVAEHLNGFGAIGVGNVVIVLQTADVQETKDRMSWFAEEVKPNIE